MAASGEHRRRVGLLEGKQLVKTAPTAVQHDPEPTVGAGRPLRIAFDLPGFLRQRGLTDARGVTVDLLWSANHQPMRTTPLEPASGAGFSGAPFIELETQGLLPAGEGPGLLEYAFRVRRGETVLGDDDNLGQWFRAHVERPDLRPTFGMSDHRVDVWGALDATTAPLSGHEVVSVRGMTPINKDPSEYRYAPTWVLGVTLDDGSEKVFRPTDHPRNYDVARQWGVREGTRGAREAGLFAVSDVLGFDAVPATEVVVWGQAPGSLQDFVPSPEGAGAGPEQVARSRARALVVGFIAGVGDVNRSGNLGRKPDGQWCLRDGELAFPTRAVDLSQFYARQLDRLKEEGLSELPAEDLEALRHADTDALAARLERLGLLPDEIAPTVARLRLVAEQGLAALREPPARG
ncbi:MAG: hypothetical protein IPJ65_26195 [Archangiaceae bacterium]|nr:hypothetical protein [Archangiaceae bacterium]